ncbi:hypothetical protein RKLH11_1856 [Rhodobacteraceae bacterium KLH11]|nr:hypothetical protein RKLH11_1856 [Rhodobacteraceae bacterium KLH11]
MSKLEQILASNGRSLYFRRKVGGIRAGLLLLALGTLLIALAVATQPHIRDAIEPLFAQLPGL